MRHNVFVLLFVIGFASLVCAQPNGKKPETGVGYENALADLSLAEKQKLDADGEKLKALGDELEARAAKATKAGSFDKAAIEQEFRTILKEPDAAKRSARIEDFRKKYEPQFQQRMSAAGIDMNTERQRMAGQMFPGQDPNSIIVADTRNLQIIRRPPPDELMAHLPESTISNRVDGTFRPPYTAGGTTGTDIFLARAEANPIEGSSWRPLQPVSVSVKSFHFL